MNDIKLKLKVEEEKAGKIGNASPFEQMLYNKTKVVEKEFKEFEVGQTFPVGYELTGENYIGVSVSKTYIFKLLGYEENIEYHTFMDSDNTFCCLLFVNGFEEDEHYISSDYLVLNGSVFIESYGNFSPTGFELVSISDSYGTDLLGEYVDKQLTAQEVYDSTKFKDNVVYTKTITDPHSIAFGKLADGLYELKIESENLEIYKSIFRIKNGITGGIYNVIYVDEDGIEHNGGFAIDIGSDDDEGYYVMSFYGTENQEWFYTLELNSKITLTRIL